MNQTTTLMKDIVPGLLGEIGVTPKNFAILSIVERELSAMESHVKIVGFKNSKIYVEVESSVVLHECSFKKREILNAIRDAFPLDSMRSPLEIQFYMRGTARAGAKERARASTGYFQGAKK